MEIVQVNVFLFLLTGHRIWHTHMIPIEMVRVERQQFLPFYNIIFSHRTAQHVKKVLIKHTTAICSDSSQNISIFLHSTELTASQFDWLN